MKVGIIGMGRFGELLYAEIHKRYHNQIELLAYDKKSTKGTSLNEIIQSDIIFIAVPISEIESLLQEIAGDINPNALVIDVASVKIKPIEWMQKHLPETVEILGTHPMFGPDSISEETGLAGLPIAVVPVRLSPRSESIVMKMVQDLELNGFIMSAEEHDRAQAYSQIYTHLIGRIGDKMKIKSTNRIDTQGFKQLLGVQKYVVNDSLELFKDMNTYNPFAKEMREEFGKTLSEIEDELS